MKTKICGITNLEDALHAVVCGADALGFVFYEKSPRYIMPSKAKEIIDQLPPFVEKIGLFVEQSAREIKHVSCTSHITLAQIHFDVDSAFLNGIDFPTLPVVRAKNAEDIAKYPDRYRLVDAFCEAYGGSGKRLNLEWFEGVDCSKIILAGGLTPDTVSEVAGYGFYGLDVSSGTEASKGIKDPDKVMRFISNAHTI